MKRRRNHLPLRCGLLRRPRIDGLLQQGLNNSLVTLIAGPGYGKTQAVTAWAKSIPQKLIWFDFLRLDNNVERFWEKFLHSLKKELFDPPPQEPEFSPEFPSLFDKFDAFLEFFSKGLYQGKQTVMIVDNYQNIENQGIRNFFTSLIEAELENFCLMLVSSSQDDLYELSARKIKNSLGHFSLTTEDMKFTASEVREFFGLNDITLSNFELEQLLEKTEGWPLALYLIRLQYRTGCGSMDAIQSPISLIEAIFESRYFLNYDAEMQNLLVQLSLLPGFSFRIIKKITDAGQAQIIDEMKSNIFISREFLDRTGRFHHMYQDFLSRKQYRLTDEEKTRIFSAAGDCFIEDKKPYEALACYWSCRRYDGMMLALAEIPKVRLSIADSNYTLSYLERIPRDYAESHPLVDLSRGFMYLNNMEIGRADEIFLNLRERLESGKKSAANRALLGEVYAALFDISLLLNDMRFTEYAPRVRKYLPDGSWIQGQAFFLENNDLFFLPPNGGKDLPGMVDAFYNAILSVERAFNFRGYGCEWLFAAEAAYYSGNFERVREYAWCALYKAQEKNQYDIICNARYVMAKVALFSGNYHEAASLISQIEFSLEKLAPTVLTELKECAQSWFYIKLGDLSHVARWVSSYDPGRYDVMPVSRGRNRLICVSYLMAKEEYPRALALMTHIENIFREKRLWIVQLKLLALKTVALWRNGEEKESLDAFRQASEMACKNHIVTPFIEAGSHMRAIIDAARSSEKYSLKYSFDPQWLDEVDAAVAFYTKRLAVSISEYKRENKIQNLSGVPLTDREREILDYLSRGYTREEIGQVIHISVNGVKKHITGIFNKLGAVNRTDALRIAAIRGDIPAVRLEAKKLL